MHRIVNLKFVSPCIIIQFKQINQLDAKISPVYYLTFIYSSTCFRRPHAHHQELKNCSSSLCYYHALKVKPEAAAAVVELLIMGVKTLET
jgi:hypothetical protein